MNNYFKNADGELLKIVPHKVGKNTIWEVDKKAIIPAQEWVDALLAEVSNSGDYYLRAMECVTSHYNRKHKNNYELETITPELKQSCVDYFNDLRDEDLGDEGSVWRTEEPFSRDNVCL